MMLTVADLIKFFDMGVANGAKQMIILTDRLGQSQPPVYVKDGENHLVVLMRCQRDKPDASAYAYHLDHPKRAQIYRSPQFEEAIRKLTAINGEE